MENILKERVYRKKCLEIVESVLSDEVVEEEVLLDNCRHITRFDYNDMCSERALIDLCGYALCPKPLTKQFKTKQKYKIDSKNNKVYEIEERKQFCSNLCFKSSNYLRQQLSEEPIHFRTPDTIECLKSIHLYCNRSCAQIGDEVTFDEKLIQDIKQKYVKTSIAFPYIREEHLEQLKDQMKGLTVRERQADERQDSDHKS